MEGQILGNRYELIEKIGGGGMALVYKAKCNLLNRFVAVKILRPEFTNDEEFVKRFRIEAQSAASLSHPNIVSIYDVGREDNIHYIVMEYVDGVTLKEYIKNKKVLDWKEAVNISIQICSAIDHAHRKRIVHRDIKPHNILMTKEGIAKVTDFGIARAVSSSTITMVGSTIGSVHYFSPEQARGGFTDEKSDLYSIGIALYEMVTGQVPFDGETPVAVALKHLQVDAQQPVDINSEIPKGVNDIIMKAIEKEQNNRFQTASEMLEELGRVLKDPSGTFIKLKDVDTFPTKRIQTVSNNESNEKGKREPVKEEKTEKEEKRKEKLTWILAIGTALVIMGIFVFVTMAFLVPSITGDNDSSDEIVLEDYKGQDINEVEEKLVNLKVTVNKQWAESDTVPKDKIISQNPKAQTKIKADSYNPVTLIISSGKKLVKIPDLSKSSSRQAQSTLEGLGLTTRSEDQNSDDVVSGYVIKTYPAANEEVEPGSMVIIYNSVGPAKRQTYVPDLINKTRVQAQKLLSDAKLKLGRVSPEESSNYVDKIIAQDPAPNTTVDEGTAVNITYESVKDNNNPENSNTGENTNTQDMRKENIILSNPELYGDSIKVLIEVIPSDTNKVSVILNEEKSKDDFPLPVQIPVIQNGKTTVKVYLDGKLRQTLNY